MSDSVTIKDGQAVHAKDAPAKAPVEKTGRVVALTDVNDYRSKGKTVISTKEGQTTTEIRGTETVTLSSNDGTGLPEEWGTIKDPNGNPCGNMAEVTGKHSISIKGMRVSIEVAERMKLIARDHTGEIHIIDQTKNPDGTDKAPEVPLHRTENLKTADHQENITALNSKGSPALTNAFISHMISAVVDQSSGQSALSDFAQAVGEPEAKVHTFATEYLNSLQEQGIAYVVKNSGGTITTAQINEHIPKLSKGYMKSLLIGLHHNNLGSAKEFANVIRTRKIL